MTDKRFVERYTGRNIKRLIGIEDIETNRVCVTIEENIRLLNELNDKNEQLKEHQRTLEAKIVRLKDRVKTFEKHYSLKDIERYKKMDGCNCITSKRLGE